MTKPKKITSTLVGVLAAVFAASLAHAQANAPSLRQ